jgi:DNA-binding NarL/FixJ family response regulator
VKHAGRKEPPVPDAAGRFRRQAPVDKAAQGTRIGAGDYNIVLVDDHALFRQGLKKIIEGRPGLKIVGEAAGCGHLSDSLEDLDPQLLIIDVSTRNQREIDTVTEIKEGFPGIKLLILTMHRDREYLCRLLECGANGYVPKEGTDEELFFAIDRIQNGESYISSAISETLLDAWREIRPVIDGPNLTVREKEILRLIAEGRSSKEVANLLHISIHTVDRHRANIMNKLKVNKVTDLVKYAIAKGFVVPESGEG